MTNTKFRKRALLSSVAMLLVAIVALGSATFAWFNTQNSAQAQTVKAQTTKGSDIVLSETGGTTASPWTHSLNFAQYTLHNTQQLVPVTTKDFTAWNYVNAADYDTGYATAEYSTAQKTNQAYLKHSYLYIKSSKAQTVTVTPNVQSTNPAFVRMAFRPIATSETVSGHTKTDFVNGTLPIIWCNEALNDRANSKWNAASQTAADAYFKTGSSATAQAINTTMTTPLSFTVSSANADKICGYEVYVWEEGTDLDCKDSNANSDVTITFDVTGSLGN